MSKEAMKLRTAAEKVVEICSERPLSLGKWFIDMSEACESLREALAEQPAKGCDHCNHPLYVGTKCKNCGRVTEQAAIKRDLTPEQPAQQEPVAVVSGYYGGQCVILPIDPARIFNSNTALYTSPPAQRKPLTDEAIATVYWGATGQSLRPQDNVLAHNFARAIEAAHGIKENT